jgi:hypothetical protein
MKVTLPVKTDYFASFGLDNISMYLKDQIVPRNG